MCYNGRNVVFPSDGAIPCGPKEKFGVCVQALPCEMVTLKGDLLYNQQCLWGSLQIVVSPIVSPQMSLMVSYVFLSLFSKKNSLFWPCSVTPFGKGPHAGCCDYPCHPMASFCWQRTPFSVWTLTVMTQFRNNLYSWMLIFEFHITFLCQEIFFCSWFFFSPVMKICSDHRKLQLGKTCRFGPRAVIGAYPNSCWNPTHCCVSSGIVPLLACACFLLNERGPWAFSQSPESPVYNRCLLNGVQMNGVAIIPLAAWRCLHETFWKWLSLS